MAVKLRLMRMGKKKQPTYRVVAADSRSPRNGRFIEIVGTYEPRQEPSRIVIDNDKAVAWLRKGAQPTERSQRSCKCRARGTSSRASRVLDDVDDDVAIDDADVDDDVDARR